MEADSFPVHHDTSPVTRSAQAQNDGFHTGWEMQAEAVLCLEAVWVAALHRRMSLVIFWIELKFKATSLEREALLRLPCPSPVRHCYNLSLSFHLSEYTSS